MLRIVWQKIRHYSNQPVSAAIISVFAINILLAVVAFGKDVLLASYLGTSAAADAFLLAFFLPDTIGNNLLAAAIGVACVPVFAHVKAVKSEEYLARLLNAVLLSVVGLSVLLFAAGYFWREAVLSYLASGLPEAVYRQCMHLYLLMLPGLLLYPLVTVLAALLQVYHRFVIPALAPVIFNACFLTGVVYCYQTGLAVEDGVYLIAAAVTCGAGAMFLLLGAGLVYYRVPVLRNQCVSVVQLKWQEIKGDLSNIYGTFGPYLLILGTVQSVLFVERYLAAFIGTGCVAAVNYAYRLAQFPIWVFVLALGTVIYPLLAKTAALKQKIKFKQLLANTLQNVVAISLPFALALLVLRIPIITMLFYRGAFALDSVVLTAQILAGYAFAIVGQSITLILLRAMMVIGKMGLMLLSALSAAIINIGADVLFVNWYGAAGIGFGAALGAAANAGMALLILNHIGYLRVKKYLIALWGICFAVMPLLLLLIAYRYAWDYFAFNKSLWSAWLSLGLTGVAGLVIYGLGLRHYRIGGKFTDQGESDGFA